MSQGASHTGVGPTRSKQAAHPENTTPFNNRECLHCHLGSRKFEELSSHHKTPELLDSIKAGTRSCMSSGCHDTIHDVASLKDAKFWKESK